MPRKVSLDEDDPVTAEYDVFITPDFAEKIYMLQYPNRAREQPYNDQHQAKPLEMRVKPQSGFIEVDIPMNIHFNYNRDRAIDFGESLRLAKDEGAGDFGLAGGFKGSQPPPQKRGRSQRGEQEEGMLDIKQQWLERFDDANDKGHVLNKQTLGGQIPVDEPGKPVYMLGNFRGNQLHLTKLDGIVQMRPQFHHIDAKNMLDSLTKRRAAADSTKQSEPKAVQQSAKSTADAEANKAKTTTALLSAAEAEPWTKLRFVDEGNDEAYRLYWEKMFVHDTETAKRLVSNLPNEDYLDAISAPRNDPSGRTKKKPLTKRQMQAVENEEDDEPDQGNEESAAQEEGQADVVMTGA